MNMNKGINEALDWVLEQHIEFGEVTIRCVFHSGRLKMIEKDLKEKVQMQEEVTNE